MTRILVLGAGAVGGYFGGRLLAAGRDVTFLVRSARAAKLAAGGLRIESALGDATLERPPTVTAEQLASRAGDGYDLVLLTCKAYDLADAVDAVAPAVGPATTVVPLLNGLRHLDVLDARFGAKRVTGGLCLIGSTLADDGTVRHLNRVHGLVWGARDAALADAAAALEPVLCDAGFDARRSDQILLEMWEKWVMLATLAAGTTLMRAPVGAINASDDGKRFLHALLDETRAVSAARGFAMRDNVAAQVVDMIDAPGSKMAASMFRDIGRQGPTEGSHVIGDLIDRAGDVPVPMLRLAWVGLQAYEAQRQG